MRLPESTIASAFLVLLCAARAVAAPVLKLTPSPIDFGSSGVLTPSVLVVTVENSGDADLVVTKIDPPSGPNSSVFTLAALPAFPATLAAGASFQFTVTFVPPARGGFEATLELLSNDPMTPDRKEPIIGESVSPLLAVPSMLPDFGMVTVAAPSDPQTVGLKAALGRSAVITSIVSNDPGFIVDTSGTRLAIADGEVTTFKVTFVPPAIGERSATVTVSIDADGAPGASIVVSGTGVPPECRCAPQPGCTCALGRDPPRALLLLLLVGAIALLRRLRRG